MYTILSCLNFVVTTHSKQLRQPFETYIFRGAARNISGQGMFLGIRALRSVSLQLFPVVWIFPRSLGVTCYDR